MIAPLPILSSWPRSRENVGACSTRGPRRSAEGFRVRNENGGTAGTRKPWCAGVGLTQSWYTTTRLPSAGVNTAARTSSPGSTQGGPIAKRRPRSGVTNLWRITCFFVDRDHRGRGVAKIALHAALESIKKQGGGIVEAFPVVSKKMATVPEWRWFGTPGMFQKEGFQRVGPLGTSGVLMRKRFSR